MSRPISLTAARTSARRSTIHLVISLARRAEPVLCTVTLFQCRSARGASKGTEDCHATNFQRLKNALDARGKNRLGSVVAIGCANTGARDSIFDPRLHLIFAADAAAGLVDARPAAALFLHCRR
jgi:hypothetical protein